VSNEGDPDPSPKPQRVLLVGQKDRIPAELPQVLEETSGSEVIAEATSAVNEALLRVAKQGYDIVVCWAESANELATVIRIRKTRPDLPILVLHSQEDPQFDTLARDAGATRTAVQDPEAGRLSAFLRDVLRSGELRRELGSQSRWVRSKATEVRILAAETNSRARKIVEDFKKLPPTTFAPILVEDDSDQAILFIRALEKAGVPPPPVLRTGEEAIAYLAECRDGRELPSVVILDVGLPGLNGLEVLDWMRGEPALSQLPVVMLSSSINPDHVNRAYELGASSYLLKPTSFSALVRMAATLKADWGA